jgi:hypothetical protein
MTSHCEARQDTSATAAKTLVTAPVAQRNLHNTASSTSPHDPPRCTPTARPLRQPDGVYTKLLDKHCTHETNRVAANTLLCVQRNAPVLHSVAILLSSQSVSCRPSLAHIRVKDETSCIVRQLSVTPFYAGLLVHRIRYVDLDDGPCRLSFTARSVARTLVWGSSC